MKYLIAIVLMGSMLGCATVVPVTFSESEYYTLIVDSLADSKDQLYLKANDWMIKTFNSAESVIQHQDKEAGVIIGKYLMYGSIRTVSVYYSAQTIDNRVYAILDVQVKDNKARLMIKPQDRWNYAYGTVYAYKKVDAQQDMWKLGASFKESMKKERSDF